jgi:hypothetical protein
MGEGESSDSLRESRPAAMRVDCSVRFGIANGAGNLPSFSWEDYMATKNKLRDAAVTIGSAVGRADGRAHKAVYKAAKAAHVAKLELNQLSKQVDALKKQLLKSSKRLKSALQ